jgi:hypothetical protein
VEKQFHGPFETASTHGIGVHHAIRIVDVAHVVVVPHHDVRLHRPVVLTKISF